MRSITPTILAVVLVLGATVFLASCQQTATAPGEIDVAAEKVQLDDRVPTLRDPHSERDTGRGTGPIVYVTSQGLYFDSIVVADPLPARGPFQLLEQGPNGLETEFGPGDRGYVGGRWKEDFDGDGTYHFFLCPLLGPGREAP